ncbi:TPA: Eaa protein, partial [Salmonella enterica]|nr:Eaa protein [Salmonella enterica]
MTTITKERIELFIKNPLENGLTRGEQMELARIALASLDAKPVAYMSRQNAKLREKFGTCDEWDVHHQSVGAGLPPIEIPESDDLEIMPLYTAP